MKKFVFSVVSRATGRLQIKPSGSGDENGLHLVVRAIPLTLKLLEFLRCDAPVSSTLAKLYLAKVVLCRYFLTY